MEVTKTISYLDGLNEQQREAVISTGRPLLVLAGAGTGKTRVVTRRIAHLIASGVSADGILAATFTKKAALEMQMRVADILGKTTTRPMICTLHALGYRILAENGVCRTKPGRVNLISPAEQRQIVARLLTTYDPAGHFDHHVTIREIGQAKSTTTVRKQTNGHGEHFETIVDAYNRILASIKGVDFDDLLLRPVQMLRASQELRSRYQQRWQHILVDEYQDTNAVQQALIRLLVGAERNICVVGDDDQSIYGFRGASIDTILNFECEFSGARVIKLEMNYRSCEEILSVANAVIGRSISRFPKRLQSQCGSGGLVVRERALNETAESKQIVDQLVERKRCGRRWRDMAVLFRVGSDSKDIRIELKQRDIPFQSSAEQSTEDQVPVMTLHRSKGLEFPVVFLPAIEEDTLPHYYSSLASDGIEEERRLFYVGVTRAQQELVLSTCSVRRGRLRTVSRFLSEVGLQ